MIFPLVSTQLTRITSTVHASISVNSTSPDGYELVPCVHGCPLITLPWRLVQFAIASPPVVSEYMKRSRHLYSVPSLLTAQGQFVGCVVEVTGLSTRK